MTVPPRRLSRPAPPPIVAKADDLEALRASVVEAAGASGALWTSFLFVLFYFMVAAGAVTHRDLFFENGVKLPFLNVDLPLKGFFWLGPLLFLVMHLYTLLHFSLLAGKVRAFDTALRAQVGSGKARGQLRRQLPSHIFVQFLAGPEDARKGFSGLLLRLVAWLSLVIGPAALLVFFQLQFLPYHHEAITWWQRIAVLLDLLLLWQLWPGIVRGAGAGWMPRLGRAGTVGLLGVLALVLVPFVLLVATFPGETIRAPLDRVPALAARTVLFMDFADDVTRRPASLFADRLVLPGLDVIDHSKFDSKEKIEAAPPILMRGRHLEGAVLDQAILRKVDFTGAYLQGASLDHAELQGTTLRQIHAQGASFFEARAQGAAFDSAQLQGANFTIAQLQSASLDDAQLQGATLDGANLQGGSLEYAQLQGQSFKNVDLRGSFLLRTQLQGASLLGAHVDVAALLGAFVWRAELPSSSTHLADVEELVTEKRRLCVYPERARPNAADCEWTSNDFDRLLETLRASVPQGRTGAALARVDPRLDPGKPIENEADLATAWHELEQASADAEDRTAEWRKQRLDIGCAADGAPYVLRAWIDHSRDLLLDSDLSWLAAGFLKPDCAGSVGLSEAELATLRRLAALAPPAAAPQGNGPDHASPGKVPH